MEDNIVDIRYNTFSKKYSFKLSGQPYSQEMGYAEIKKILGKWGIAVPNRSSLKFFPDGFGYRYAWFDKTGKNIGK